MTTRILRLIAVAAGFAAAAQLNGAEAAPKSAAAPAADTKQQKLVRVSTLNTIEANREFLDKVLAPLLKRHPGLKIVLEHITTKQGVEFVEAHPGRLGGTITPPAPITGSAMKAAHCSAPPSLTISSSSSCAQRVVNWSSVSPSLPKR